MKVLVLVHGIIGFRIAGVLSPGNYFERAKYFSGVAASVNPNELRVLEPELPSNASVQIRADKLAQYILANTSADDDIYIVAHSMGGLDARMMLQQQPLVCQRVVALATIGTPHKGSPVADANLRGGPLGGDIPKKIIELMPPTAQGTLDLSTQYCKKFNEEYPDQANIKYYAVAGNALGGRYFSALLQLASCIGGFESEPNDGVMPVTSAEREGWTILPRWPVDHFGLIGWHWRYIFNAREHINRYLELILLITQIPLNRIKRP